MKKLRHDVALTVVKALNIVLVTAPFALCWFGYYAERVLHPFYGRGNYAVVAFFIVLYVIFSHIYDAMLIPFRQINESIFSQGMSLLLSDGIMFLVLCLLKKRFPDLLPAAAAFLLQILLTSVWTLLSHKWYFFTFAPQKTAVIYDGRYDLGRLADTHGLSREFDIRLVASVDECLDDLQILDGMEAAFLGGIHSHERNMILKYCVARDISVYVIPRIGDTLMSGAKRVHMFHLPMLRVERYRPQPVYAAVKRLSDVVLSLAAIIVLSPVMAITAIAIKAADGGPVLYKQVRLTKDGRRFTMPKFRSMRVDAERDGVARLSTGDSDDRITPVGRFIRKFRVDELPQLFCTLSGSMSIVGPRPERPEIAAQYEREMPEFALRLQVKAGLTGYAQVYGKYNTAPYDKLQMDLMYIANSSVLEDFRIILTTVKVLFTPESTAGVAENQVTALMCDDADGKKVYAGQDDVL